MNFTTAEKVQDTIVAGEQTERIRGQNRAKVNDLFNSVPPLTELEAQRLNIKINTNWGEGATIAQHGRRQYYTAFLKPANFFRVSIPLAPEEKKVAWGTFITKAINKVMKRSQKYQWSHKYKWASVLSHGIGPNLWYTKDGWCPDYVAIDDLRVATDTNTDFENLMWFAVRHAYTVAELNKKVFGENANPNWKKEPIQKLLDSRRDINYDNTQYNWVNQPEKMHEIVKQNAGYYASDAVPKIPLWHFYFLDDSNPRKCSWKLRVVPDVQSGAQAVEKNTFLYTTDKPEAMQRAHILQCQFGDLNNDAPFKYHSVRSLGFELMEPCFWMNLTRCRLLQHTWENFNVWLRVMDPAGKARAQKVELFDKCIVPEGVSIVPQTERHQINENLVTAVMQELRQLMAETGVSYTQDVNEPGSEEETATKTMARLNQVNALMGGLLDDAFNQEIHNYREICRRFCLSRSHDLDVIRFQKLCKEEGIERRWLNEELWDIEPEVPLGSGNQPMAMAKSIKLMELRPMMPPSAQNEVLHEAVEVLTEDSRKAQRWIPIGGPQGPSDAQTYAATIFGTLMQGVPVPDKPEFNPIEQIEVLLGLMGGVVSRIEQTDNVGTMQEIAGLNASAGHVAQLIQRLAQNPQEAQRVKQYQDSLGELQNLIKAFTQRLMEKMSSQNGDPEAQAKIAALEKQTNAKLKSKAISDAQKLATKQQTFEADQQRKNVQLATDEKRKNLQTISEIEREAVTTAAELANERVKTDAEIENQKKAAEAAKAEQANKQSNASDN